MNDLHHDWRLEIWNALTHGFRIPGQPARECRY
jgi:hypothetical protein